MTHTSIVGTIARKSSGRPRLEGAGRDAGLDEAIGADAADEHAAKIGAPGRLMESQPPGSSAM